MRYETFLQIVETEAGGRARRIRPAVVAALRETVTAEELADLTAQLSEDYAPLFARP